MKDDLFIRGNVPMTKEAVRLFTLDRLDLATAKVLIDVGAGTGSLCIEASLRYPALQITAIEKNPEAIDLIQQNCQKFGVRNLAIIKGLAPRGLPERDVDAIFVGGSGGSLEDIISWASHALVSQGRLVLNFILLNNLLDALALLKKYDFEAIDVNQLQLSRLTNLGEGYYFKPNNPTYIISCTKEVKNNDTSSDDTASN